MVYGRKVQGLCFSWKDPRARAGYIGSLKNRLRVSACKKCAARWRRTKALKDKRSRDESHGSAKAVCVESAVWPKCV